MTTGDGPAAVPPSRAGRFSNNAAAAAYVIPVLLAVLAIGSRLPFRSHILHHWDSVNFALAMEEFDIRRHQPHPPGMFVFYVFLGKAVRALVADANAALVSVSIFATGAAVALAFVLGRSWFGWWEGWVIALLTLSSPLVWFHGEVALSYMVEFAWVLLVALASDCASRGSTRAMVLSALLLGLSGGFRPDTPLFLFPMWCTAVVVGARRLEHPMKRLAAAFAVLTLAVALWAVPLIVLSGGPAAYWSVIRVWRSQHMAGSGTLPATLLNATRLSVVILYGLGCAIVPFAWVLLRERATLRRHLLHDWRAQMIALWVAPGLAFLTFVHIKQPGHIFGVLPALLVVAGVAIARGVRTGEARTRMSWLIVVGLVVAGNSALFMFGPAALFGSSRMILNAPTWAAIRDYDRYAAERLAAVRAHFSAGDAAVLTNARNFRLPDYYLREFTNVPASPDSASQNVELPDHVHTLVLFDESVQLVVTGNPQRATVPLADGGSLRWLSWSADQRATVTATSLAIADK